jgi:hypothetical protein
MAVSTIAIRIVCEHTPLTCTTRAIASLERLCLVARGRCRYDAAVAFEDVAKRMRDQRSLTGGERLHEVWTGEEPQIPPLPDVVEPVAPAARTRTLVGAYALLVVGLLVMFVGAIALMFAWDSLSRWETRACFLVIVMGIAIIVRSTTLFDRVEQTSPLPGARLRK